MVESLSSDGMALDRSSTEAVSLEVAQNIMLAGSGVEVINANRSSNSPEVVLWTTSSGEQGGTSQTSWTNSNGAVISSPVTPSTPLNTPLSSVGTTPQSAGTRGVQARQPASRTPPARMSTAAKSSPGHFPLWTPQQWRTESKYSGSKLHGTQVAGLLMAISTNDLKAVVIMTTSSACNSDCFES